MSAVIKGAVCRLRVTVMKTVMLSKHVQLVVVYQGFSVVMTRIVSSRGQSVSIMFVKYLMAVAPMPNVVFSKLV